MTVAQIQARGVQLRNERGDLAKELAHDASSCRRFIQLTWLLEARRMNLRTANRRWQRRNGKSFT